MHDIAIIGGGLGGLMLAATLEQQGRDFALYEARNRLGGRILSVEAGNGRYTADLGPAWFWPETQPRMKRLIADLGLTAFAQHDDSTALYLDDPDKPAIQSDNDPVHIGAHRISGGMARLVEALAVRVATDRIHLGPELTGLRDCGDHIEMQFRLGSAVIERRARKVVLALPPRLAAERVTFVPGLDEETLAALRETSTWMATSAKAIFISDRPFWLEAGKSGNAFVTHEQAVLSEIHDACDPGKSGAALSGFLALPPALRVRFAAGLPMLLESQMMQVFGQEMEGAERLYHDWARERFTCGALDRLEDEVVHPGEPSNPMLRRAIWQGKLMFGGSETAVRGAGYLEGALDAAARVAGLLVEGRAALRQAAISEIAVRLPAARNAESLERFSIWVAARGEVVFDSYRQRLKRSLMAENREQLTQRAMLGAVEELLDSALAVLDNLDFDSIAVEGGRSALIPAIQTPFQPFLQGFMDDVLAFNRTSCALSNFPYESQLSADYRRVILADVAAAWKDFSLAANRRMLARETKPSAPVAKSARQALLLAGEVAGHA